MTISYDDDELMQLLDGIVRIDMKEVSDLYKPINVVLKFLNKKKVSRMIFQTFGAMYMSTILKDHIDKLDKVDIISAYHMISIAVLQLFLEFDKGQDKLGIIAMMYNYIVTRTEDVDLNVSKKLLRENDKYAESKAD